MQNLKLDPRMLAIPSNLGGKPTAAVQAEYGLTAMIECGSNENPLGPSPLAIAAFQEALKNAHRYPGAADGYVRQKLATHCNQSDHAALTADNFFLGNGLSDVIRMLVQAFIFDGGETLICTPTFPMYRVMTQMFGGKCTQVPHANYHHNLSAMADAITPNTRIVFVCNPNNPTGTLVTRAEVVAFMARIPPAVIVAFDEAYCDFVDDLDYSNALGYVEENHDQVLVLRTFSKSYGMAGLRVGYAIGTRAMVEYLLHAKLTYNTSDATLYAAAAALDDVGYLQNTRDLVASEKQFLYAGFTRLGVAYVPTHANFILIVALRAPRDVQAINQGMLRRGIIIRPMGGFGMPDAIRVTIGTHEQNVKLLEALEQVLAQ
jgi:histidinol-phosphate aminotransferase